MPNHRGHGTKLLAREEASLCADVGKLSAIAFVCGALVEGTRKRRLSEYGAFVNEGSVSGVLLSTYLWAACPVTASGLSCSVSLWSGRFCSLESSLFP